MTMTDADRKSLRRIDVVQQLEILRSAGEAANAGQIAACEALLAEMDAFTATDSGQATPAAETHSIGPEAENRAGPEAPDTL